MTVIVLLGAGASFGSVDVHFKTNVARKAPPLGCDLFNELEATGGIASTLPDDLKAAFRCNFEEGMALLFKDRGGDVMRFQRELAHYLVSFRPGPENIYGRMLKALGTKRVIYSSLNYDMLFELSAGMHGVNPTSYCAVPQTGALRLLKIHGSANFRPDIPPNIVISNNIIANSGGADIAAPVKCCDCDETLVRCKTEDSLAPAIAMYAPGKSVRVSPDFVRKQQTAWAEEVAKASIIFVAGVRVYPTDEHIWKALAESPARLTYFGAVDADRREFDEWKTASKKRNAFSYARILKKAFHG